MKPTAKRIAAFHRRQLQKSWQYRDPLGMLLGQRITPLERVGVYVPAGKASYPSTVLMNVIPAKVAGVKEIIMTSPIGKDVTLSVLRDGKPSTLTARVAKREQPTSVASSAPAEPGRRGRLGLAVEPVTPSMASQLGTSGTGVIVRQVSEGSPAADAGLRPGDIIVEANRAPVKSVDDLQRALDGTQAGSALLLLVQRDGTASYLAVKV